MNHRGTRNTNASKILDEIDSLLDPSTFIGRAPEQVMKFTGMSNIRTSASIFSHVETNCATITGAGGEVVRALAKYEGKVQIADVADLHV